MIELLQTTGLGMSLTLWMLFGCILWIAWAMSRR